MGILLVGGMLAGCSGTLDRSSGVDSKYGVTASRRVVAEGEPVPKGGGRAQVGKPYTVAGRVYVPREEPDYDRTGIASWYGRDFHGRLTANGEVYDRHSISAAHPTMPLPAYARVTNLRNNRSMIVRVNDRGPYSGNRIIDLSEKVAELLEFNGHGLANVRVQYVGPASLDGSDDRVLMASLAHQNRPSIDEDRRTIARLDGRGGAIPPAARPTQVADASPAVSPVRADPNVVGRAGPGSAPAALPPDGAAVPPPRAPVKASAEAGAADPPAVDGAPLSILPQPAGPRPDEPSSFRSSYADERSPADRIGAAHAIFAQTEASGPLSGLSRMAESKLAKSSIMTH